MRGSYLPRYSSDQVSWSHTTKFMGMLVKLVRSDCVHMKQLVRRPRAPRRCRSPNIPSGTALREALQGIMRRQVG